MHPNPNADRCGFGTCRSSAERIVTSETPIGGRVELLCTAHAQRRHELEHILEDQPIPPGVIEQDEPPLRAIGSVTRFVHEVADEAAREAMRLHVARYHNNPVPIGTLEDLQAHLRDGS